MAEDSSTSEQKGTPTPTPSVPPAPPGRRRGPSVGAIITFVIAIPVVLVAAWFGGEIKAFFTLQPWNKSLPIQTVERFVTALQANDRAGMQAVADVGLTVAPPDEGPITGLKIGGPPMEPLKPVEAVRPTSSVSEARIQYDFRETKAVVRVHMTAEAGGPVIFEVKPIDGKWRVRSISLMP